MPISLHLNLVKHLIFLIKNTPWKQILNIFSAQWAASLSLQPSEETFPVEDMFELVAVEADNQTFRFKGFEADGAGFWKAKRDLVEATSFLLLEHLVVFMSKIFV